MRDFKTKPFAYKPIPSLMDANSEIGGHEVTYPFSNQKNTSFSSKQSWKREQNTIYIYIHNKCMYIYIYIIYIIVNYSIIYIYRLYHIYIYTYILSFKNPFNWRHPCDYFPISITHHHHGPPDHRPATSTPHRCRHSVQPLPLATCVARCCFRWDSQIHPQRCHHPGWWLVPQRIWKICAPSNWIISPSKGENKE